MDRTETKRQRISTLIDAQVPTNKICEVCNCSRFLVAKVKKLKEAGDDL